MSALLKEWLIAIERGRKPNTEPNVEATLQQLANDGVESVADLVSIFHKPHLWLHWNLPLRLKADLESRLESIAPPPLPAPANAASRLRSFIPHPRNPTVPPTPSPLSSVSLQSHHNDPSNQHHRHSPPFAPIAFSSSESAPSSVSCVVPRQTTLCKSSPISNSPATFSSLAFVPRTQSVPSLPSDSQGVSLPTRDFKLPEGISMREFINILPRAPRGPPKHVWTRPAIYSVSDVSACNSDSSSSSAYFSSSSSSSSQSDAVDDAQPKSKRKPPAKRRGKYKRVTPQKLAEVKSVLAQNPRKGIRKIGLMVGVAPTNIRRWKRNNFIVRKPGRQPKQPPAVEETVE